MGPTRTCHERGPPHLRTVLCRVVSAASLPAGRPYESCPADALVTDEQARDVAAAAIHSVDPRPCYSTYRNEHLESFLLSIRKDPLVGNQLNSSVYFYRVSSDVCSYVVEKDGKHVLMSQVSMDCCEYGTVAVDRATAKSYWFAGKDKAADIFKEFAQDEQLRFDSSNDTLFVGLYLDLVWGEGDDNEIRTLRQLRELVQSNFLSAYSPYERDNVWERKFRHWWQRFQSRMPQLNLETTYEPVGNGTLVRGYAFRGFALTIPRTDPPPKGTPTLFQWSLLVKPDGTIEERPSKVVYSSR
jgi:hypothetical protein